MNRFRDTFGSPTALLLFFGTTIVGVSLDLWTKNLAVNYLEGGRLVRVIPHLLDLTFTRNPGAVFGLGEGWRTLFIAVSILAIGFLSYLFAVSGRRRWYQFLLGLLLAGVLGNMYDRIVFGKVRDMILGLPDVYWPDFVARFLPGEFATRTVFPWVFNVADSMLCVGVFLMILYNFFDRSDEARREDQNDVSTNVIANHGRNG